MTKTIGDPHIDETSPANSGELIIPWRNVIRWPEGYVWPMGYTVTQHPTHSPGITVQQLTSSIDDDYSDDPEVNLHWLGCDKNSSHRHWGPFGGAGLLFRHKGEDGQFRYLLTKRASHTDEGDTWSIPGGAINFHDRYGVEDSLTAARREATEELGQLPQHTPHSLHINDHGGWGYATITADVNHQFTPTQINHEIADHGWFTEAEMRDLPLHSGFKEFLETPLQSRPMPKEKWTMNPRIRLYHGTGLDSAHAIRRELGLYPRTWLEGHDDEVPCRYCDGAGINYANPDDENSEDELCERCSGQGTLRHSRSFVYLTTDPQNAELYAKAHAANEFANKKIRKPTGVVLGYDINPHGLLKDPYNPKERFQYMHDGPLEGTIDSWKRFKFKDLYDPSKLLQYQAYYVGVHHWGRKLGWKTVSGPKTKNMSAWHKDLIRVLKDQGARYTIGDNGVLRAYGPNGVLTTHITGHGQGQGNDPMVYRNNIKILDQIGLGSHPLLEKWRALYKTKQMQPKKEKWPTSAPKREQIIQEENSENPVIQNPVEVNERPKINVPPRELCKHEISVDSCSICSKQTTAGWKSIASFQKHAPYGIPKEKGGDSPKNVERMERCVNKLMEEGHDKSSAIAICKSNLGFTKTKKSSTWKSVTAHNDSDWDDWDDEDWDDEDWDDEDWDEPTTPISPSPSLVEPSGYNEKDDPLIAFVNASTLLSDKEIELIQKACQKQVDDDYGPFWHIGMRSVFTPKGQFAPQDAWQIIFLDKATIAGALGYHDFINGQPIAYVFITTSQQAGVSVSSVASHEALEMLSDPLINTTAQVNNQTFYALESCDAVQQSSYNVTVELDGMSYPVEVSNFVTPEWFRTQTNGPWDYLRKLNGPLELLPNGSYIGMWTPKTGWVQKNAYGKVEPLEEDDKRYVGDEAATTIYHAPQEPQRCLRPFQRRQMDKPLQVTSSWNMVKVAARDEELFAGIEFYHFPNSRNQDYMITAQHSSGKALGYILFNTSENTIKNIEVSREFRRRGVATALWHEAKKVQPTLQHSMDINSGGREWAKTLDPESSAHIEMLENINNSLDKQIQQKQQERREANWKSIRV